MIWLRNKMRIDIYGMGFEWFDIWSMDGLTLITIKIFIYHHILLLFETISIPILNVDLNIQIDVFEILFILILMRLCFYHDDIKWKFFPCYWPFVWVTGGFVTRSYDVFFDLHLNKRLNKQSKRRWLCIRYDVTVIMPTYPHQNLSGSSRIAVFKFTPLPLIGWISHYWCWIHIKSIST